jgi:hypothetical protein
MSEMAHQIKAKVLLWRGEVDGARVLVREFLPRARAIDDLQLLVPALAVAAAVALAAGDHTAARGLLLPAAEYTDEHLPGAINLPLKQLDATTAAQLDPARPVIVYCWDSL